MQRADVVFLVVDALDGVTQQDKAVAGEAVKDRKPIVVIVNKWDLVRARSRNQRASAVLRASAITGRNTSRPSSRGFFSRRERRLSLFQR